jgi:surface polysaccharide O-acyltransferase-like enzyme
MKTKLGINYIVILLLPFSSLLFVTLNGFGDNPVFDYIWLSFTVIVFAYIILSILRKEIVIESNKIIKKGIFYNKEMNLDDEVDIRMEKMWGLSTSFDILVLKKNDKTIKIYNFYGISALKICDLVSNQCHEK